MLYYSGLHIITITINQNNNNIVILHRFNKKNSERIRKNTRFDWYCTYKKKLISKARSTKLPWTADVGDEIGRIKTFTKNEKSYKKFILISRFLKAYTIDDY